MCQNQLPGLVWWPIRLNGWSCSPSAYPHKVYGFRIVLPIEHEQLCHFSLGPWNAHYTSGRISQPEQCETRHVQRRDVTLEIDSFLVIFWPLELVLKDVENLQQKDSLRTVFQFAVVLSAVLQPFLYCCLWGKCLLGRMWS